jgi:hypothetical protein
LGLTEDTGYFCGLWASEAGLTLRDDYDDLFVPRARQRAAQYACVGCSWTSFFPEMMVAKA